MTGGQIVVFDVNETLLDLESIRPFFDRVFNHPAAMRLWFGGLITYSEALTLAGVYVPFTDIGRAVLRMLATTRGIKIADKDGEELTQRFASMPAHPEVPAALRRLRDRGSGCSPSPTTRSRSPAGSSRLLASSTSSSVGSASTRR
jgi:2-haloacid dehalogenase